MLLAVFYTREIMQELIDCLSDKDCTVIAQEALEILERHAVYVDSGQRDSRALAFRRAACALKSYPK